MSPPTEKEPSGAESTPKAAAVREQLRRLLAHPLFTHSKRYPVLLAHAVEQALQGNAGGLKERTIGVEAFGREPDYDVNLDPVVRTTAAEVRKRLIQYYYSPEHAGELVIEMPVGSYVPSFHGAARPGTGPASGPGVADGGEGPSPDASRTAPATAEPAPSGPAVRHWSLVAIASLVAASIGFGIGRVEFPEQKSNLELFWEPIVATSSRVTYCLGEPAHAVDREGAPPEDGLLTGNLDVSDVITLARSIVPLVPRNGAFRVVAASDAGLAQLREGPIVLIGAYDNVWTMRITRDLPFGFEYDGRVRRIVDRKSAQGRSWDLQWQVPHTKLERDYAIVARIHDNLTGQPVIILAGILGQGTEAAGEAVSNPAYLGAMLQKAPRDWARLNLEAVIETRVIEGHPGPPTVIAVETW